ncbi:hypothetical protein ABID14_000772 [Peptoniphilus olsenii]|uniref:Uncharacterized protein n=1 Tax=Peptoniphilus olsenii TaxID=411570 RepID=A0ABV2J8P5_9FIRM
MKGKQFYISIMILVLLMCIYNLYKYYQKGYVDSKIIRHDLFLLFVFILVSFIKYNFLSK